MFTAVLPQTADPIPAVLPSALSPLPRSPRYSRRPHYRAALYTGTDQLNIVGLVRYLDVHKSCCLQLCNALFLVVVSLCKQKNMAASSKWLSLMAVRCGFRGLLNVTNNTHLCISSARQYSKKGIGNSSFM